MNITNIAGVSATAASRPNSTTRVRLGSRGRGLNGFVTFDVTPALSETASASYRETQPSQAPGNFFVYSGSTLRSFSLADVKLLARTRDEALDKLRVLNLIRSWVKPYFGKGNIGRTNGLPPDVLMLSAYGAGNIRNVPVILQNYTIDYPNDTDYIYVNRESSSFSDPDAPPLVETTAVPIVSSVTLQLQEVRSMSELNSFDLEAYRSGDLVEWR